MELIWDYIFHELKVLPEERSILLSEAQMNPKENREKMIEILFETFMTPATYVALSNVLSSYYFGRSVTLVIDIGDGVLQITPILEGYLIAHAMMRSDLAGRVLTEYMMNLLNQKGYSFTTTAEREIAKEIKEQFGYVALDFNAEMELAKSKEYEMKKFELPNKEIIKIGKERFECTEALFKPSLLGRECLGIHEMLYESLMKCDVDIRKDFCKNIYLTGGTTFNNGIADRIKMEITNLMPTSRIRVVTTSNFQNDYSVWIGGSIRASLSTFHNLGSWLSREEYEEIGYSATAKFEEFS